MSGGSSTGNPGNGSASNPALGAGIGGAAATQAQMPQWLKGLQLGQQLASQAGQMGPRPAQPQMPMQRPMMGMPGGMPQQGVVPGAVPQQPMGGGMMSGGMGMPQQGQMPQQAGGINPQLLQMLMRSRQQ